MGFWNFLGGLAIFNWVLDMFSSKPKTPHNGYRATHDTRANFNEDYNDMLAYGADDYDPSDIDDMRNRLDELKERLDSYDYMDDYEREEILDEIDDLQHDLDDYEDW